MHAAAHNNFNLQRPHLAIDAADLRTEAAAQWQNAVAAA